MTNAELFKKVFGIYAEEFWAYPKEEMLEWLASDAPDADAGDLISRRAAIDLIHKTIYGFFDIVDNESEEPMSKKDRLLLEVNKAASNGIKNLSPAQPERKKGKWIDPAAVDVYRCSVCEEYTKLEVPRLFYHYCPNCGAEMEGGEDA